MDFKKKIKNIEKNPKEKLEFFEIKMIVSTILE